MGIDLRGGLVPYYIFIGIIGVSSMVWQWFREHPRTEAGRDAEIARLEKRRDALLDRAPRDFNARRALFPVISVVFVYCLYLVGHQLFRKHDFSPGFFAILGLLGLLLASQMYKLWIRPPARGDKWGMSDAIAYRGDSPRVLQRKIDRLRAESSEKS